MTKDNHVILACFLFVIMVVLQGCATKMSIEEAKTLSVSMEGSSFVPPPRHINDILKAIDQPGEFNASVVDRLKLEVNSPPPTDTNDRALAVFYRDRGDAARQLGKSKQALNDLRTAYDIADRAKISDAKILLYLAMVERSFGNINSAIEYLKKNLKAIGQASSTYSGLAETYLELGDFESAGKIKDEGIAYYNSIMAKSQNHQKNNYIWANANSAKMEAIFLEAQGKYKEAEPYRRSELEWLDKIKDERPLFSVVIKITLSANLLEQNRLIESEIEARQAIKEAIGLSGTDSAITRQAVSQLSKIMLRLNRTEDAKRLIKFVIDSYAAGGLADDTVSQARNRLLLGNILMVQKDFTGAASQYDLIRQQLIDNKLFYDQNISRNSNIILSLIKTGRSEEAVKFISYAYDVQRKLYDEKHYTIAEIIGLRGMANLALHQDKEALHDFAVAAPILAKIKHKNIRVRAILESYLELLSKIQGTYLEKNSDIDAVAVAFTIANSLTALSTQTALAESSARAAAATDPELADMVRNEQDLQKQVTVLESKLSELLGAPSNEQDSGVMNKLRSTVESLNLARTTLQDEITRRFPKYAEFTNPDLLTVDIAQKNLYSNEALVLVYTTDDKTYTWTISHKGEAKLSVAPLGTKELALMVGNLRKALDPNPETFKDIPAFDVTTAYELYSRILKPMETSWSNVSSLVVVVNGPLGQLPLSVLPTESVKLDNEHGELYSNYRKVPWLIRKVSLCMLPSVNSLITLRALPAGDPSRKAFVGFGDPAFNREQLAQISLENNDAKSVVPETRGGKVHVRSLRITEKGGLDSKQINSSQLSILNRLPDTAEEIREVATAMGADLQKDVYLGRYASKRQVKTMNLIDRKVISFATHALVPGDLDGLDQPALALSSPEVTGDKDDGLLTMGEIMKLKLNADWVVLSACNTGAAEGAGAEAVSGLGKAFFYAGTRTLLVTMWPVETTSAKLLVKGIFQFLNKGNILSRSSAIRESMLDLIDNQQLIDKSTGKIVLSYAHPIFWAPFVIVGDPGQGRASSATNDDTPPPGS